VWEGFRLLQENVQQQGWRTYLYDAEQPYTPVASVTGKGESRHADALRNGRVWQLAIIYLTIQVAVYGLIFFLPTQVAALLGTKV
ncbi:hypothetical protein ONQ97_26255, partial [Salmonella enterica subsp. enterica serovar Virginia]|nr:hypothetical protein [Salmonella enterica subsp. enterica serovar Virginia]